MTDEQLHLRTLNKRIIAVAILLLLISGGLMYYWYAHTQDVSTYKSQKNEELRLQSELHAIEESNNSLRDTIDQTGKELVSFSEDKLKYINLASSLSEKHNVTIDKLAVSDVWTEGQMAGMTTEIQFIGSLSDAKDFINDYCSTNYTNRINVVSLRPIGRFPWLSRSVDDKIVLQWFDLTEESNLYMNETSEERRKLASERAAAGLPDVEEEGDEYSSSISLSQMFADKTYLVYMKIDFLGRG